MLKTFAGIIIILLTFGVYGSTEYQPTTFMVDITPKFPNSIMKITAAVNHKNSFNGYYHTIAVFKRVVG